MKKFFTTLALALLTLAASAQENPNRVIVNQVDPKHNTKPKKQ